MSKPWTFGRAAAALAVTAAVGACAPGGLFSERVTRVDHFSGYAPGAFSAFAASHPLLEVQGPIPGGATPEAVAAALKLPPNWPQSPFSAVREGEAAGRQRIVIGFGSAGGANADRVCAGQSAAGGVADRLEAVIVYCTGARAASTAHLSADTPLAPGDPAFAGAFARAFMQLVPSTDPNRDRSDCRLAPRACR